MKKNVMISFATAILSTTTLFILFAASQAHAYAVGSLVSNINGINSNAASGSSDISSSLRNLISPFTGFVDNLKWNSSTTIGTKTISSAASGTSFIWPTVKITPTIESTVQNTLSQWFGEFDHWFYGLTGVQLSGIMVAILNVISWALHLAESAVSWLIGLFH